MEGGLEREIFDVRCLHRHTQTLGVRDLDRQIYWYLVVERERLGVRILYLEKLEVFCLERERLGVGNLEKDREIGGQGFREIFGVYC